MEIDARLIPLLESVVEGLENVRIIHGDILDVEIPELLSEARSARLQVVGNLPYNITTPVVLYIVKNKRYVERALVTVQWEYAERMLASPGSRLYGSMTVLVQFHCEIAQVMTVSPSCFYPEPDVGSMVLQLRPRQKPAVQVKHEPTFELLVRAAFSHRRKTLSNSIAEGLGRSRTDITQLLRSAGVEGRRRAEQLGLEELGRIADVLYDEGKPRELET